MDYDVQFQDTYCRLEEAWRKDVVYGLAETFACNMIRDSKDVKLAGEMIPHMEAMIAMLPTELLERLAANIGDETLTDTVEREIEEESEGAYWGAVNSRIDQMRGK